jgi:hypothetical protein
LCGPVRSRAVVCGLPRSRAVPCGPVRSCAVFRGPVRSCAVECGQRTNFTNTSLQSLDPRNLCETCVEIGCRTRWLQVGTHTVRFKKSVSESTILINTCIQNLQVQPEIIRTGVRGSSSSSGSSDLAKKIVACWWWRREIDSRLHSVARDGARRSSASYYYCIQAFDLRHNFSLAPPAPSAQM